MKSFLFLLIPAIVLIRLGFPPFNLAPLTLAGWAILLYYSLSDSRTTFRAFGGAWLAGFLWNLSMTVYVAFPHWATSFGWIALSAYLALYWLVWVWGCRLAVKKRIPIWFAAPVLWTGLELIQGHLLSGFLLNQQAIIFYKAPVLLQLAEFGGSYAISFIVMLLSALVYHSWKNHFEDQKRFWALLSIFLIVGFVAEIGIILLNKTNNKLDLNEFQSVDNENDLLIGEIEPTLNIALIQGNIQCQIENTRDMQDESFETYTGVTFNALKNVPRPDIVVWPEGMFRDPRWEIGDPPPVPSADFNGTEEQFLNAIRQNVEKSQKLIGYCATGLFKTCFVTGVSRCVLSGEDVLQYNSVVGVDSSGRDVGQYDKQHLVLFGEYIPFADQFPILKQITPVGGGMQAGNDVVLPLTFQKGDSNAAEDSDWTFLPSVCYENTLPHVIRSQVLKANKPVDALLNLSNDGWFRGCFENELRLAQDVFRAIETRKTHLIASNGGISAYIDPTGRILQQGHHELSSIWGGRVKNEYIPISLKKNAFRTVITKYVQFGDAFAGACLFLSLIILFNPLIRPSKSLKSEG